MALAAAMRAEVQPEGLADCWDYVAFPLGLMLDSVPAARQQQQQQQQQQRQRQQQQQQQQQQGGSRARQGARREGGAAEGPDGGVAMAAVGSDRVLEALLGEWRGVVGEQATHDRWLVTFPLALCPFSHTLPPGASPGVPGVQQQRCNRRVRALRGRFWGVRRNAACAECVRALVERCGGEVEEDQQLALTKHLVGLLTLRSAQGGMSEEVREGRGTAPLRCCACEDPDADITGPAGTRMKAVSVAGPFPSRAVLPHCTHSPLFETLTHASSCRTQTKLLLLKCFSALLPPDDPAYHPLALPPPTDQPPPTLLDPREVLGAAGGAAGLAAALAAAAPVPKGPAAMRVALRRDEAKALVRALASPCLPQALAAPSRKRCTLPVASVAGGLPHPQPAGHGRGRSRAPLLSLSGGAVVSHLLAPWRRRRWWR